jgi:hypothetical protein
MGELITYIEDILANCENNYEVKFNDEMYEVIYTLDYRGSKVAHNLRETLSSSCKRILSERLNRYLPDSLYVVKLKEINIPIPNFTYTKPSR